MFARLILTVPLLVLTSTACNSHRQQAVQVSTQDAALNTRWHANLASPASLAGVVQMNGSASMAPGEDGTTTHITISLANASPGGLHPWSAHWGQCGTGMDQGVFGPSEAYTSLSITSAGQATATATVPLRTPTSGRYFVVVRASEANPGTIVACGNLAPPTQ